MARLLPAPLPPARSTADGRAAVTPLFLALAYTSTCSSNARCHIGLTCQIGADVEVLVLASTGRGFPVRTGAVGPG